MTAHPSILLIEDSPGECELFRLALVQTGLDIALYAEPDAEAAFRFLEGQVVMPDGGNLRATSHPPSPERAETRPFPGEALPRARVPRAQDPAGVGNQRVSLTARSVSTGDRSGHPHPSPSLILLDLNLCGQHGCDFLKRLRADARFSTIPVVIFTTSDAAADIERCYANGANSYVVKPGTYESLVRCIRDLCGYWVQWNRLPAPHPRGVGDQLARP